MRNSLQREAALVDGRWTEAADGARYNVCNPATGEVLCAVPDMSAVDAERAIASSARAFDAWKSVPGAERARRLSRWFELLGEQREALAELITLEEGKPLAEARAEVDYGAAFVDWFAGEARRVGGDVLPSPDPERRMFAIRQPVGVVAAITPWNFPVAMVTRKCAPALAAGCTVVLKPAEATPLSALAVADLALQAGIPPGVFNVVTSSAGERVGGALTGSPLVRKLSFTGSTATGKRLLEQCAPTVKKVSLELGGNAPFIVFDDADLERAVAGAVASKYRNTGQTCICANRFLVQSGIYDDFAERLAERVRSLAVGAGVEPGVQQGPLINVAALEKVMAHVDDARQSGARVLCGGQPHPRGGTFYEPTVLVDVNSGMQVAREETFGPVAALIRFDTEEEAIAMANDTRAGLAAYLYSRSIDRTWRVAEALEYGMVGVNETAISSEVAPFGGVKESGLGREGSRYGIEEFLELKYIALRVSPD